MKRTVDESPPCSSIIARRPRYPISPMAVHPTTLPCRSSGDLNGAFAKIITPSFASSFWWIADGAIITNGTPRA